MIERAEHVGGLTADSGLRVGRWRGVQCLKETVKIRGSRIQVPILVLPSCLLIISLLTNEKETPVAVMEQSVWKYSLHHTFAHLL